MNPQEFAEAIRARYPSKSPEKYTDLVRHAGKYSAENLDRLLDAVIETYDKDFLPSVQAIMKAAELRGIARGASTSTDGYNADFGGFLVMRCNSCQGIWHVTAGGPECIHCGKLRTGNETMVVLSNRPNFRAERPQVA